MGEPPQQLRAFRLTTRVYRVPGVRAVRYCARPVPPVCTKPARSWSGTQPLSVKGPSPLTLMP